MKKLIWIILILVAAGAGAAFFYTNRGEKEPTVTTLKPSRGSIIDAVGATGTLQAVRTVTVGTQVSGIVQELYADFNAIVRKGQVVARLDPSILETQVETARANMANATANLERQRVTLNDAQAKLTRARELSARQLINKVDLENAEVTVKQAEAQLKSTQSSIVQAEAAVNKAKVDLDHTVITAPIDGIVIKRSVDKGQTVAASMSAPELFIIAADLTQMQVNASIDESDVGRMRPGQAVTFRVDAYPTETFHGTVNQVRLNPVTVQNVVTYATVIDVPNPELKLKPGMTANVTIEISRRDNVLRVPNAAIRFRPTKDIFEALNQPVPPELERGMGGRGNRGGQGGQNTQADAPAPGRPGAPAAAPGTATTGQVVAKAQQIQGTSPVRRTGDGTTAGSDRNGGQAGPQGGRNRQQADAGAPSGGRNAGGGGQDGGRNADGGGGQGGRGGGFASMTPEERQKRMEERMASMSPEERAAFQERMKERQAQSGGNFGGGRGQGGGNAAGNAPRNGGQSAAPRAQQTQNVNPKSVATTNATTIDALFAPLPVIETRGRAWTYENKQLKSIPLRLGISDGTFTEVLNDTELPTDAELVTSFLTPAMAAAKPGTTPNNPTGNPLMPAQRGRGPGGPGGGRGGG
ncbi:MAG: efflux RND transporter periplasmic adaptor subunit [Vicinamibacterales bacterium]